MRKLFLMKLPRLPFIVLLLISSVFYAISAESKSKLYDVKRVSDGDTIVLSGGPKIRLIGIDTPESANNSKLRKDSQRSGQDRAEIIKMGKEALAFTRSLVEGQKVRVEYDVQKKDRYGRSLGYVYRFVCSTCAIEAVQGYEYATLDDGVYIFVNATIIKSGFASQMTVPPNVKHAELFRKLYREARESKRGLWKDAHV